MSRYTVRLTTFTESQKLLDEVEEAGWKLAGFSTYVDPDKPPMVVFAYVFDTEKEESGER